MVLAAIDTPVHDSRAERLKEATNSTHERLDRAIMSHEPFASRKSYRRFLDVQYVFHRDIEALYTDAAICSLLPCILGRSRLERIERDLHDLGGETPQCESAPVFQGSATIDVPVALGWLYVAEGSNLGAAFLLREAEALGLSSAFGARHLTAAPEGRGLHWRNFKSDLDAVHLTEPQENDVVRGALAAFNRVRATLTASEFRRARMA